jgi:hypothetical protein
MTLGEVGVPLILVTIPEGSRLCNIAPSATAGITRKLHIQLTSCTTSLPMTHTDAAYEMTTSVLKTPVQVGQKFVHQKTHGTRPQVENGPSATLLLPILRSILGLLTTKEPLPIYNVKGDRIGGKKRRAGIGTTVAVRAGGQTTHGRRGKVVIQIVNIMTGSVGIFKATVLNAMQKTEHGSLLPRGSHRRGAVGAIRASVIRATSASKIETGIAEVVGKVAITISKNEISDLTIVT